MGSREETHGQVKGQATVCGHVLGAAPKAHHATQLLTIDHDPVAAQFDQPFCLLK
jgi:hypothetical protein